MPKITLKSDAQLSAEASVDEFKNELGPFVVAAETTRMPMIFTDAKAARHPIIFVNNSFLALTGYDRDELLAQEFNSLLLQDPPPEDLASIAAAFDGDDVDPEARFGRKNARSFWATIFVSPVRDAAGDVVEHFVSLVDTTKHKDEQDRCKLLIDELNHRVKNTLSTVQSIIARTIRTQSDPQAMQDAIESRIFSLSRSHDLLSNMNWKGAWLHDVVDAALEPFGGLASHATRFVVADSEPVGLTAKASLVFGIAFHELATNAAKYGALASEQGSIDINWAIVSSSLEPRLLIHWKEKNGPLVSKPTHTGFGTQVIERGVVHELGGQVHIDYRTDGLACVFDIPAPLEVLDE